MRDPKPNAMHESAAIAMCRLAFIGLGLAPVLAILVWTAASWTPFYTARTTSAWQQRLSTQIGLDVHIEEVSAESPWRTRLKNITLLHPETGEEIASAGTLWLQRNADSWLVQTPRASISQRQLDTLARSAHDWVLCRPRHNTEKVVIAAATVELRDSNSVATEFRLTSLPDGDTQRMLVQFELPEAQAEQPAVDTPKPEPIQLFVRREQSDAGLTTGVILNTGNSWLPVAMLPPQLELPSRFGDSARVQGQIGLAASDAGWKLTIGEKSEQGEMAGRFTSFFTVDNLDFTRLTANTLCELHGVGSLTLGATVSESSIIETHGHVFVDREVKNIGGLFVQTACNYLGLDDQGILNASSRTNFPFEQLSLAFGSTNGNLYLAPGGQDATILMGRDVPLVQRHPQLWQQPIPLSQVTALLRHLEQEPTLRTPFVRPIQLSGVLARMLPANSPANTQNLNEEERLASDSVTPIH